MCKISVIVPVYNGEKYLNECIKSIQNQTLADIEIICIDDGSTDATAKLLNEFASEDTRIKVVHKENSGYGASMNVGINLAQGEYIAVVESDDYIDENMYQFLYQIAHERNLEIIKSDYTMFYGDGVSRRYVQRRRIDVKNEDLYDRVLNYDNEKRLFGVYMLSTPGIYKRDFLISNHITYNETPGASYQDNGFWFQTMMYASSVMFVRNLFYNVRRDNESSSIYNPNKVFCIMDEYDYIRELIQKSNFDECKKKELLQIQWNQRRACCESDMMRISKQFYTDFCKRYRQEMQYAIETQEFDISQVKGETKERLLTLLFNEEAYINKYFTLGEEARRQIMEADGIVIYGAKWNARKVLSILRNNNFLEKFEGIVVSNKGDNVEVIDKYFVTEIGDYQYDTNTLFIISSGEKYIREIKDNLRLLGYSNFLEVSAISK